MRFSVAECYSIYSKIMLTESFSGCSIGSTTTSYSGGSEIGNWTW